MDYGTWATASGWGSPRVATDAFRGEWYRLKLSGGRADTPAVPEINQPPEGSSNRRTILSSARALEVLRYHLEHSASRGLHLCPQCNSRLVQPIDWHEGRAGFWELMLECPNCCWQTDGVY